LETNQVLLEPAFVQLYPLLDRRDGSLAAAAQSGNEFSRRNERITRADARHRLSSEDGRSQRAKLFVGQLDAFTGGDGITILSEVIWPFVHGLIQVVQRQVVRD